MNPKYTARIAITRMSTPISDTRVLTPSLSRTRGRAIAFSGHRGVAINIMVPASKRTLHDTQRLGKGGVVKFDRFLVVKDHRGTRGGNRGPVHEHLGGASKGPSPDRKEVADRIT